MALTKQITFREANPALDYEFARTTHHAAYKDVVTKQFGSWDEKVQDTFFKEGWERAPSKIILEEGIPIGVLSFNLNNDHLFLSELQILPSSQNRGIGSHIVKGLIAEAQSLKIPLRLQVLKENKAVNLYGKLGFVVVDTTAIHIRMERA
jgi:GNAT superfamily N-acetyltransferase